MGEKKSERAKGTRWGKRRRGRRASERASVGPATGSKRSTLSEARLVRLARARVPLAGFVLVQVDAAGRSSGLPAASTGGSARSSARTTRLRHEGIERDLLGDLGKHLDDALARLGTRLKEQQAAFFRIVLGLLARDLPPARARLASRSRLLLLVLVLRLLPRLGLGLGVVPFGGITSRLGGGGSGLLRRSRLFVLVALFLAGRRTDEVDFVASERSDDIGVRLPLQLLDPGLGLLERGGLRDVKDDDGGLGVAVVHRRQRAETLLTGRVPDLKLDHLVLEAASLREERGADSRLLVWLEVVLAEPENDRRLADGRLAEQDELDLDRSRRRLFGRAHAGCLCAAARSTSPERRSE